MISSTQKVSALRNGERGLFSRSSISAILATGSSAASMSVRGPDAVFQRQRPSGRTPRRSQPKRPAGRDADTGADLIHAAAAVVAAKKITAMGKAPPAP